VDYRTPLSAQSFFHASPVSGRSITTQGNFFYAGTQQKCRREAGFSMGSGENNASGFFSGKHIPKFSSIPPEGGGST